MVLGKAIGGAAFIGLLGVGGVAIAKPEWMGMADPMPKWHSLSEDSDFGTKKSQDSNSGGYQSGMGKKYSKYLVGVTDSKNKDWWEWSFRRLEREKKSDNSKPGAKFANATGHGEGANAINKICEAAYKANHSNDFVTGSESDNGSKYKEDDVWKYCSPGPLVLVSDNEYGSDKIGGGTDKSTLVSVKNSANDWFWEKRNEDFWSTDNDNEWSSSKATSSDNKSVFKLADETKSTDGANKKTIKQLCEEAYKKSSDNATANVTDAKRFCALKISS